MEQEMPLVEPKSHVMKIVPYIAGEAKIPGFDSPAKLSSNESPLGASPAAIRAYSDQAGRLELYPDGAAIALRQALAQRADWSGLTGLEQLWPVLAARHGEALALEAPHAAMPEQLSYRELQERRELIRNRLGNRKLS